jgi:pimeloyl-ACP methyl ester carboxylesterase
MKTHSIEGAAGVVLHVREWGNPAGIPILLIHGWSQSQLCWMKQGDGILAEDHRMVALDLRGHGMSDAPLAAEQYADGDRCADDRGKLALCGRRPLPVPRRSGALQS